MKVNTKQRKKTRYYTSLLASRQPLYLTGPKYGPNYHEWLLKVKGEFDPLLSSFFSFRQNRIIL